MHLGRQPPVTEGIRLANRRGTLIALLPAMMRNLKERIRARVDRTEFGDRLLEIAKRIESDFKGREQERLLDMVEEALDRHIEIREAAESARGALEKIRSDQHALLRLFDFITANPERETIH
jgi:hypothetical protein